MKSTQVELQVEDQIALVTIARPEAMNALNRQVLTELDRIFGNLAPDVRAVMLTGSGPKAFVAGADIKELETLSRVEARALATSGQALMQKIEDLPVPVIAAVNGFALGGGLELALSCDFIVASEEAKWGLPEVTLGLIPGYGGTQRLSRNVGRTIARRVALSGELFTAEQGLAWGLFAEVVPKDRVLEVARRIARALASRAPRAMQWTKEAINVGFDRSLAEGLELEADLFARTFDTADKSEGVAAFVQKRAPIFRGS